MPRQPRLEIPGFVYHVLSRGIERKKIFHTPADYDDFLSRIEPCLQKSPNQILAWCLMPNHFHLLIRCGSGGIGNFMKRLLAGYATSFNLRHQRTGYLFQNRYKSILCQEDLYLKELVRYIHLNPLRGNLVKDFEELENFPYSGHNVLMGKRERHWQDTQEVLSLFGQRLAPARETYDDFLRSGGGLAPRPDLVSGGLKSRERRTSSSSRDKAIHDNRVLGSEEFVQKVLLGENSPRLHEEKLGKMSLEELSELIAKNLGIGQKDLFQRSKKQRVSEAKAMFIYAGVEYFGRLNQEMAKMTKMEPSPASRARSRGKDLFEKSSLADLIIRS